MAHSGDGGLWSRPPTHEIEAVFKRIFRSNLSLSQLQQAALDGRLASLSSVTVGEVHIERDQQDHGVVGRSMAWKLFLTPAAPLVSSPNLVPSVRLPELRASREAYRALATRRLRAPDGSYAESVEIPGIDLKAAARKASEAAAGGWEKNNPLSLDAENPWQQWFADVELRRVIAQDVERTFPEVPYFTFQRVRRTLATILFLHCASNPRIGYRQGMHELLGPIVMALDCDSVALSDSVDHELVEYSAREWIAADAYLLFGVIMRSAGKWYEWREPSLPVHGPSSKGHAVNWVPPIVLYCNQIQEQLLRPVDPALWAHMDSLAVEPQIYGIRWLRLLFTREFPLPDALMLWDALFAADSSLDLARWICVAMLLRIRNELINSDYSGFLSSLLHYPSLASPQTAMLVKQAIALQANPTPREGIAVVLENRSALGIPMEIPTSGSVQTTSKSPERREQAPSSGKPPMGLTEMIARNLMDRSDALGLNRAFLSTVSEIRKNLPELPTSLPRPLLNQAVPLSSAWLKPPSEGAPHWSSTKSLGLEVGALPDRDLLKRLGGAMQWALEAVETDGSSVERRHAALCCLANVRDVMLGTAQADEQLLDPWSETQGGRQQEEVDVGQAIERTGRSAIPDASQTSQSVDSPKRPVERPLPTLDRKPPLSASIPPVSYPIASAVTNQTHHSPSSVSLESPFPIGYDLKRGVTPGDRLRTAALEHSPNLVEIRKPPAAMSPFGRRSNPPKSQSDIREDFDPLGALSK